jgi:RHS repeat-associated protein
MPKHLLRSAIFFAFFFVVTTTQAQTSSITKISGSYCSDSFAVFQVINPPQGCSSFSWGVTGAPNGSYSIQPGSGSSIRIDWVTSITSCYVYAIPCSGTSIPGSSFSVQNQATASVSISASKTNSLQGDPVVFTATPTNGGTAPTYQWRINSVNYGTASSSNIVTISTLSNNDVVSVYMNSNSPLCLPSNQVTSNNITMTVRPKIFPVANAGSDLNYVLPIRSGTISATVSDADGTISSILWTKISAPDAQMAGTTTSQLQISELAVGAHQFRITVTDNDNLVTTDDVNVTVSIPSNNYNYVKETSITQSGVTSATSIPGLSLSGKDEKITYMDGLGRPIQSIAIQSSPGQKDIVQPVIYDQFGREPYKYLPYTKGTDGNFKTDNLTDYVNSDQYKFYNASGDKIANDANPYSQNVFENSPLSRPLQQFGVGAAWRTPAAGASGYIAHKYLVNVHGSASGQERIIAWLIDSNGKPVRSTTNNTQMSGGFYTNGQLAINETVDEQNHSVREYTDKNGRTILKKVQLYDGTPVLDDTTHWTQTYYIYDDFGSLRYVLQPKLVTKLIYNNRNATQAELNSLAFQYQYDSRHRMIQKQVPGADAVYMVYDVRDRVVFTQDGNQRINKDWSYTKYDQLNRPIVAGIYTHGSVIDQATMSGFVSTTVFHETYNGDATTHGYTNNVFASASFSQTGFKPLTVSYYDNYSFTSILYATNDYGFVTTELTGEQATTFLTTPIGKPTGSRILVLEGGTKLGYRWLATVSYYDCKYRMIQTVADNYKGGTDRTTNVYDFPGRILKTKTTHKQNDVTWKDRVGVAVEGGKIYRTATGTASGTDWTTGSAGAASVQVLPAGQKGWVEFTVTTTSAGDERMIGLSEDNPDSGKGSIDFAFSLSSTLKVYRNGSFITGKNYSYSAGENIVKIERTGDTINYYLNKVLRHWITGVTSTSLMVDASFYNQNSSVTNVRFSQGETSHSVIRRFEYDEASRLTKTWHLLDVPNQTGETEVLLTYNEYNELGQLVDKKLHSTDVNATTAKQSVDYRYNIRGWLTKVNESDIDVGFSDATNANEKRDLFGMELGYESSIGLNSTLAYNGNISAMKWSHNAGYGSIKETGYKYGYDPLNRINLAMFKEQLGTTQSPSWTAPSNSRFYENGYTYDLNGNITHLARYDERGTTLAMDYLGYTYSGNQLLDVNDTGDKTKGFIDEIASGGNDYTYDTNGNMITDQNKGITSSIVYNHLNLPELVTKGGTGGNNVRYIYDASGRKLSQVVTFGGIQKQTDYAGEFQYENDALQFVSHEEGRIVIASTKDVFTDDARATANFALSSATLSSITQNAETYTKVVSTGTTARTGAFPICYNCNSIGSNGSISVEGGKTYKIKARVYRDKGIAESSSPAYLLIKVGGVDQGWPGASVPASTATAQTETWIEQTVTIPSSPSTNTLQAGVVWSIPLAGEALYINDFVVTKLDVNTTPEYQYNLKDHLGNVRVTFTSQPMASQEVTATFENANQTAEILNFDSYPTGGGQINTQATNAHSGTNSQLLNGGYNGLVGVAKSYSVMPGDVVQIQAYAKFSTGTSTASSLTSFAGALLAAFHLPTPAGGETGTAAAGINYYGSLEAGGNQNGSSGSTPKIFVTILLFDKNYNFLDVTYQRVANSGDLMSASYTVKEPGYAYMYVSNENGFLRDVYFDDVTMTYTPSPVVSYQDYYPFGMTFNSFQRNNSTEQKYQYNGKELQDELNLAWLDYGARLYMSDIGRWSVVDPLSEEMRRWSCYNYAFDNPIRFIDPDGMAPETVPVTAEGSTEAEKKKNLETYVNQVNEVTGGNYEIVGGNLEAKDGEFGEGANADTFKEAIESPNSIPVNVVNEDPNTFVDGFVNTNVDVGDIAKGSTEVKGALYAHVMTERLEAGDRYSDPKKRYRDMSGSLYTVAGQTSRVTPFDGYHSKAKTAELDAISYHTGISRSELHERGEGSNFDCGKFGFKFSQDPVSNKIKSITRTK